MQVQGGGPVFTGGELQVPFIMDSLFQYPNHVFGQIFIERLDQRQPFEATVNVSNDDVPDSDPEHAPGIITYCIRSKADWNFALGVGSDGLQDKGWVCMKERNQDVDLKDLTVRWQINGADGSIRSAADPNCILCCAITAGGIQNKGKVWIWKKAPGEEPGEHGVWYIDRDEDTFRVQADPDCLLAVAKHGVREDGQVWMWRKLLSEPESVDMWCKWHLTES